MRKSLYLEPYNEEIVFMFWDLEGEKVNKLSTPVIERLKELVEEIKRSSYKAVILYSLKPSIFVAGADIGEILSVKEKDRFYELLGRAHEVMNALENLPQVSVAAIHGACLGGGCELVLSCDHRLATDHPKTILGLPEVKLGLFPGFGGCLRFPRVVGLEKGLDVILAGKTFPGKKAYKMGLVDGLIPQEILKEKALEYTKALLKKGKRKKRFRPRSLKDWLVEFPLRSFVFYQAKKVLLEKTKGFYPAPLKALKVIQKTYRSGSFEQGLEVEKKAFCDVAVTATSKNLIDLFYLMESVKKQTGVPGKSKKDLDLLKIKNVGVLGAGVMGGEISWLLADKGHFVRMKDIHFRALFVGMQRAYKIWKGFVKKRKITPSQKQEKWSRIGAGLSFSGFKNLDLIIEAVIEDEGVKKSVIREAVEKSHPEVVVATNTSSLNVSDLSEAHPHPQNFLGMHFFNPVHKMPLVEVVAGEKTSERALASVFDLAKRLGKFPVVVKDGPGFLVNRLLVPWLSEALFLLEQSFSVKEVDKAYTDQFGFPMGPFRLLDEVGWDVGIKVLKTLNASFPERMPLPSISEKILKKGRLGKKNGKGFYLYKGRGKDTNKEDSSLYLELQISSPKVRFDRWEVIQRGVYRMVNEAAVAVKEDKVVFDVKSCDFAMIMGAGFPPFRGGVLKHADSTGIPKVVETLNRFSKRWGKRFSPCQTLQQMASKKESFYP